MHILSLSLSGSCLIVYYYTDSAVSLVPWQILWYRTSRTCIHICTQQHTCLDIFTHTYMHTIYIYIQICLYLYPTKYTYIHINATYIQPVYIRLCICTTYLKRQLAYTYLCLDMCTHTYRYTRDDNEIMYIAPYTSNTYLLPGVL